MKIRTKPKEYEAIQFNGINQEVEDFIQGGDGRIYEDSDGFIFSNIAGNHRLNIGDFLYRHSHILTMICVVHNDDLFGSYFEVVEND